MNVTPITTLQRDRVSSAEALACIAVFCVPPHHEEHELYIRTFKERCALENINCTAIKCTPLSVDHFIETCGSLTINIIVCLDNNYASMLHAAYSKMRSSALLLFIDWGAPAALPTPLPAKYKVITAQPLPTTEQLCSLIPSIATVHTVGLLYDPADQAFINLIEPIAQWLESRAYRTTTLMRKPTISTMEITAFGACDMLIFLCKVAPEEYIHRLATVCKQQHTLLYATNQAALAHGAAFAFVPHVPHLARATTSLLKQYVTSNALENPEPLTHQLLINELEVAENPLLTSSLQKFMQLARTLTVFTPTPPDKVCAYLRLEQIPLE